LALAAVELLEAASAAVRIDVAAALNQAAGTDGTLVLAGIILVLGTGI
jgi:hypothetical protein